MDVITEEKKRQASLNVAAVVGSKVILVLVGREVDT
jgi:hypothetical protein